MCFSSEASFIAGGALIACSVVTLRIGARIGGRLGARVLPLAAFPLVFGLQQISEGFLWLSFDTPSGPSIPAIQVFLFFAYLLWPVVVPLSVALVEPDPIRRRLFHRITAMGAALGLLLYVPGLLWPTALEASLVQHAIQYVTPTIYPSPGMNTLGRVIYAAIICTPLLGSSHAGLRGFGFMVLGSVVLGFVFAAHAFTSIWCFLAAGLSAYMLVVLRSFEAEAKGRQRLGSSLSTD